MYCPNCGVFINGNVTVCTSCGVAITPSEPAPAAQDAFPDPTVLPASGQTALPAAGHTVLPTPEQNRIDPNKLSPEMTPNPWEYGQNVDIDSVVSDLNEPEPEPVGSKQGFTDQDMAWFTDHQKPQQTAYSQPTQYPQQTGYPQPTQYRQQTPYPQPTQYPQQTGYPQQPNYPQTPYPQQIPGNPNFVPPVPVDLTPRKSNVLLGILGAVVFSLIGCVIWVLIGSLGYISYIGALAMSFLTITGYKVLGKKFDIPGVLSCIVVVALAVLASNVFINALVVANDADTMEVLGYLGYNNFSDVFLHFFDLLNDLDEIFRELAPSSATLMRDFLVELGLSYVFAGIAFAVVAVPQYKSSKNR